MKQMVSTILTLLLSQALAQTPAGMGNPAFVQTLALPANAIAPGNPPLFLPGQSTVIALTPRKGVALLASVATTNAGTGPVLFVFDLSADGTNYTTGQPITFAAPLNGTAGVIAFTNIGGPALDNVRFMRLTTISNLHSATAFVTNLWRSST